ncbi:hypothetical protein BKI52_25555 [marine bacterium AO1-C]|nr:hypothetical protein BKI52_25555 [marine bacterium AO1-C]
MTVQERMDSLTAQYVKTMKLTLTGDAGNYRKYQPRLFELANEFAKNPIGKTYLEKAYKILKDSLPPQKYNTVLKMKKLIELHSEPPKSREEMMEELLKVKQKLQDRREAKRRFMIKAFISLFILISIIAFLLLRNKYNNRRQ